MMSMKAVGNVVLDDLVSVLARKENLTTGMIQPFADFTATLAAVITALYRPGGRLLAAGHVDPEVEMAADRADIALQEQLGESPFVSEPSLVTDAVQSPTDMIYVANPNRITGANYSYADLEHMAKTVSRGALIIDEYYFDFFGISGLPLLQTCDNVVLIRSFAAPFGVRSSDIGYIMSNPALINALRQSAPDSNISGTERKTILTILTSGDAMTARTREIHDESLRLATALNRQGVQCRITATDFLLMRVADPARVGNHLARFRTTVDNLDGYPGLDHYVRYRIQSPLSNDRLIEAFTKMPTEYYHLKSIDRRALKMRLGRHQIATPVNRPTERTTAASSSVDRQTGPEKPAPKAEIEIGS